MSHPLDIGVHLVSARKAQGVTQRDLGLRLDVSQPQIARWETNAYRTTSLENVDAVARVLGLELEAISLPLVAEAASPYSPTAELAPAERALARLGVGVDTIAAFCRLHGVAEFALFGSCVRRDFGAQSDVDVLVAWREEHRNPQDAMDVRTVLAGIFGRPVDVVDRAALERSENYLRRRRILEEAVTLFVAR